MDGLQWFQTLLKWMIWVVKTLVADVFAAAGGHLSRDGPSKGLGMCGSAAAEILTSQFGGYKPYTWGNLVAYGRSSGSKSWEK